MSYRMTKSMALFALILMALPVVAFAQTSRLEGMVLQGDYVKDYTAIFTYPSQVPNVGNLAYGEMGNTGGTGGLLNPGNTVSERAMGSVLGNLFDGRLGAFAIHLRQTTPPLGLGSDPDQDPGSLPESNADPNTNNHEQFDLMWGKKFGTMSLGARLQTSRYEDITSPPAPGAQTTLAFDPSVANPNLGRNIFGLGGGISFEMNPNSSVDIGLLYQSRTFEVTTNPIGAATNSSEDSPTCYMLSGRLMWQYQSNLMVTPIFKYYSHDLSRKEVTAGGTTAFDNTLKGWQLGAAANWSLGSNDMLVWGVDFLQNKVEQTDALLGVPGVVPATANSDITESMTPRIFAALETHVNSWLTLRFGASKGAFSKVKVEPRLAGGTSREITLTSFNMNMGAGVKLGTVQLDAVLADNTFQYANGLLGGVTPDGGFFPKVTATYSF